VPNDCVCEKERDKEKNARSKEKMKGGAEERERRIWGSGMRGGRPFYR
jgi:hypothetical protein